MSDEFADWREIGGTIARYGRYADQRRFTDMAELFEPDGRMWMYRPRATEPAEAPQGRAQLTVAFEALAAFAVTSHVLAPSEIEIDGDAARACTSCMAHHISETADGKTRFTLADRYVDTLVRAGGRWLFRERRKYTDWTETVALRR